MKKIFSVALAATLLAAGCQKTEVINYVGDRIGFSSELAKLTKATGTADAEEEGEVNLLAQDFRVWTYYVEADANTGANANDDYDGMIDMQVFAPGTEGKSATGWSTDKDYYWPGKGKDLKFFAVSGVEEGKATVDKVANTITVSQFTVEDGTKANTDLMVADFVQQSQEDNNKQVPLSFNHALTKVEFLFQTTSSTQETIYVQRLEVAGLKNTGKLTVSTTTTNFGTANSDEPIIASLNLTNESWTETSGTVNFVDDYDLSDADCPTDYTPAGAADSEDKIPAGEKQKAMKLDAVNGADVFTTWLMIPQTVEDKTVKVTYLIDNRQFVASFPLDGITDKTWVVNQYVKYTVTLAPNKISFSANVKPWNEDDIELGDESEVEAPAVTTYNELVAGEVTYYYEGDLAVGTAILVKDGDNYVPATVESIETTTQNIFLEAGVVKSVTAK